MIAKSLQRRPCADHSAADNEDVELFAAVEPQ